METSNPGKCNYSYLTRIWLEMFVPSFIFAAINNEWETRFIGWSKCPTSVTRWPDCFFNLSPFTTIKFCPKAYKKSQSGFTTFQNIKETFQMLPKIYKFLLIWRNFAKSGHAVVPKPKKVPRLFFHRCRYRIGRSRLRNYSDQNYLRSSFDISNPKPNILKTFFRS